MKFQPVHGMYGTPTYSCWAGMVRRCHNPHDPSYKDYGAKGITVCERWRSFTNFFADMGLRPQDTTLDRIDNSKGYEPANCQWRTWKQQQNNRTNNTRITYQGQTKTLQEWADTYNLDRRCISKRLKRGWSVHAALTTRVYE